MLTKAAEELRPWAVGDECTANTGRHWFDGRIRSIHGDCARVETEDGKWVYWCGLAHLKPRGWRNPEVIAAVAAAAHKARCDSVSVEAVALLREAYEYGWDPTCSQRVREILKRVDQ